MEIAVICFIILGVNSGLTKGAGILPDGPLNATVGGTVMFTTLIPPGKPFISTTWRFGAKFIITSNIANTTNPEYGGRITFFTSTASLELRNLALNDSGEYIFTIISHGEEQKDGTIRLDVYVRVSDVMATASSTDLVEFNSSVRLSCSSSGSSLSFLWLNGSSEVTESDRVQLTDGGANLTIASVSRYDQAPFRCRASNPVSEGTSDPRNLSVSFGPENINLTQSPSHKYFAEGSNISLSCSAVSRPSAQFMWFLNGEKQSDTGPELRLMNIQESQSGNYSCQAFNNKTGRYETSQPSEVFVLVRISRASVTSSTNQTIEGKSVNLTCDAAGSVFTRKWKKNGSDLTPADNIILYDNNRVLSFKSLNKTDSGEYFCNVSNPINDEETTYSMVVNYGPENVRIIGPSKIHVKQPLNLTCFAESTPWATYIWTLNGTEIHNSSVFTKDNTELSDSGDYTCRAMNNITGKTSSSVHHLSVTAFPDETSSCSAGCIAGIIIAVLVVCGAVGGGGYYIYKKKKRTKKSSNSNTDTNARGEGQDNTAFSGSQELNYADVRFFNNKDSGTVQLGPQNDSTEYAQVRAGPSSPPAAASPPTYDVHMQQTKRPAPQPCANGAQLYAQVRKT